MVRAPRRARRWRALAIVAIVLALGLVLLTSGASAATLFSDDFQDGNANGWSRSGGSWSVVTDGSLAFQQSSTGSDAKAWAGSGSWSDYTAQARVKATAFNGSDRYVALLARVQNATNYYYLALRSGGRVELGKRVGGGHTALASAPLAVSTGTWYTLALSVAGSGLQGSVNGTAVVSASDASFRGGMVGLGALFAAGRFDDVLVATGTPTSTTQPTTTTTPPTTTIGPTTTTLQPPPPPPGQPVGWASVNADGQNGTNGGVAGATVTVADGASFAQAAASEGPLTIRVQGTFALPDDTTQVSSDKSIIGVGSSSGFSGGGLNLGHSSDEVPVHNVIIRNLSFANSGEDAINMQYNVHHVWIDHNDFCCAADGLVDIKRGSSYITVSWNHFHDHQKTCLLGHDDGNASQDVGRLKVTYHHNWFDGTTERHPRVRFGDPVHVFNNYYLNNSGYGVASTEDAGVLVEGNYFENVPFPTHVGYQDSGPGRLVERQNVYVNSGTPETAGSVPEPRGFYGYTLDNPQTVKSTVMAGAGVGKIGA